MKGPQAEEEEEEERAGAISKYPRQKEPKNTNFTSFTKLIFSVGAQEAMTRASGCGGREGTTKKKYSYTDVKAPVGGVTS